MKTFILAIVISVISGVIIYHLTEKNKLPEVPHNPENDGGPGFAAENIEGAAGNEY